MNKVLMSLLFGSFILTGISFAQTPPAVVSQPAPAMAAVHHAQQHPEIHKALRKLRGAKEDLLKAARDYGGHKAKAIEAIDRAIEELQAALATTRVNQ